MADNTLMDSVFLVFGCNESCTQFNVTCRVLNT